MTVDEVMAAVERDRPFYEESGGGVTFSGGEPLMQPAFLLALLRESKARGLHTAVDTCGFATGETLELIRPYVDLFLYDLKVMDDRLHRRFTSVSNGCILKNLEMLSRQGHALVLRVPIVPGVNDEDAAIGELGRFMAGLPHLARVDILAYHRTGAEKYSRLGRAYPLPDAQPPSEARMAEIARQLQQFGVNVKIGG
jgi:pyruvate formate lyase activating enzyme